MLNELTDLREYVVPAERSARFHRKGSNEHTHAISVRTRGANRREPRIY